MVSKKERKDTSDSGRETGITIAFDSNDVEMLLCVPGLAPAQDGSDVSYLRCAVLVHGYLVACPNRCGNYAFVTPNGTHCQGCGFLEHIFLGTCAACGGLSVIVGGQGPGECQECET